MIKVVWQQMCKDKGLDVDEEWGKLLVELEEAEKLK